MQTTDESHETCAAGYGLLDQRKKWRYFRRT